MLRFELELGRNHWKGLYNAWPLAHHWLLGWYAWSYVFWSMLGWSESLCQQPMESGHSLWSSVKMCFIYKQRLGTGQASRAGHGTCRGRREGRAKCGDLPLLPVSNFRSGLILSGRFTLPSLPLFESSHMAR